MLEVDLRVFYTCARLGHLNFARAKIFSGFLVVLNYWIDYILDYLTLFLSESIRLIKSVSITCLHLNSLRNLLLLSATFLFRTKVDDWGDKLQIFFSICFQTSGFRAPPHWVPCYLFKGNMLLRLCHMYFVLIY